MNFKLTYEGFLPEFLGVKSNEHNNKTLELTQSHLIERTFETLGLNDDSKIHDAPANGTLHKDADGKNRVQSWNYRSTVSMLNYVASTSRPDIVYAVNQCDMFYSNPKKHNE